MLYPKCLSLRFAIGLLASLSVPAALANPTLPWVTAETRGLGYEPYFLSAIQSPVLDAGAADDVRYGHAVALDGDWLLVGVPDRRNGSGQTNGAVFLYQRQGAGWVQRQRIQFGVGGAARCGHAVALKNTVALIGCPSFTSGGLSERGRVLIYRLNTAEGQLTLEHTLLGEVASEQCGYAVAVAGTGLPNSTYAAMGCPGGGIVGPGSRGRVNVSSLVFAMAGSDGSSWGTWGTLSPEGEGNPLSAHWRFGAALAMERIAGSVPQVRLLVGMPGATPEANAGAGLAFLYERPAFGGSWSQEHRFTRPGGHQSNAEFGFSVSLVGSQAAIGAPGAGHDASAARAGMAYRFRRLINPISGSTFWTSGDSLGADMARLNPAGGSRFGHAVAISGSNLWIGQPTAVPTQNKSAVWRYSSNVFSGNLSRLQTDIHQGSLIRQSVDAAELGFALGVDQGSQRLAVGGPLSAVVPGSATGLAFVYQPPDRMFADRFRRDQLRPGTQFRDCDDCPIMVMIPGGSFTQGSPLSEPEGHARERPQRQVNLAAFAMGQTEVSFAEWDACVSDGGCTHIPSDVGWGRGDRPVMNVSWDDAQQYVAWLSARTGRAYRLPSESEWEYATRAGTTGRFHTGDCITTDEANFAGQFPAPGCADGIARNQALPAGRFAPNEFGLYDTHGNVREWTQDCWNANYSGAPTDGSAWLTGDCDRAVVRNGGNGAAGESMRSAHRLGLDRGLRAVDVGFRIARSVTP